MIASIKLAELLVSRYGWELHKSVERCGRGEHWHSRTGDRRMGVVQDFCLDTVGNSEFNTHALIAILERTPSIEELEKLVPKTTLCECGCGAER